MVRQTLQEQVTEIRRWHVQHNGWSDIGYHWIVGRLGDVLPGRDEAVVGAHVRGHNRDSIGICLIGGAQSSADDEFYANFTEPQRLATIDLIKDIRARYGWLPVRGHNEYAAKACPGFHVKRFFS